MPVDLTPRNLRNLLLALAAMLVVTAAVWLLRDPLRDLMADVLAVAGDLRGWLISLGPLAPAGYFLFYAAQIIFAPLPGGFLPLFGGYLFGFWWGLLLSLAALALGVSIAVYLSRRLGRRLIGRFWGEAELLRWERKLSLRSPIPWFVLFLFPVPDTAVYFAGLSSLNLRVLLAAIILGRGANVALGIALGNASNALPAELVAVKWIALFLLGGLALRHQRPIRYWVLIQARRARRLLRPRIV